MEKKRSLLSFVKRLFSPSSKPKSQEKSKNWRWKFIGQHKYPAIKEAPPKTLNEAAEEQRKQAVVVAVAAVAAADAAVSSANAAAEVVRLASKPKDVERRVLHLAAIEIQAAYRGHLARKALSALKGIVKLQAVVRGELMRTSVVKRLASKAQPLLVRRNRVPPLLDDLCRGENRRSFVLNNGLKYDEFKLQCNTHSSLDLRSVSSEAATKREFTRRYSFSHWERRNNQILQEPITVKQHTSTRFDQLAETEELKPTLRMNTIAVHTTRLEKLKLKTTRKNESVEDSNSSYSQPRRSLCHAKQKSIGDYESLPNSPVFPAYMAATESTKAKSRSFSTPRQRKRLCETHSSLHSPYKLSISSCGSFNVK